MWTALVIAVTLIRAWYFPALAPALNSLVPAAVPATLGGRTQSQTELRFLCPGVITHSLGRRQALRFFRGFGTVVVRLLRKRQKWSQFGLQLQAPNRKSLLQGLARVNGKLTRKQVVVSPSNYQVQSGQASSRNVVRPISAGSRTTFRPLSARIRNIRNGFPQAAQSVQTRGRSGVRAGSRTVR